MSRVAVIPIGPRPTSAPTSAPSLSAECTQHPGELEVRVVQDALDGGPADVAGRPLHDAIGHGSPPWCALGGSPYGIDRRRAHYVPGRDDVGAVHRGGDE